jgi:hypothetical protein
MPAHLGARTGHPSLDSGRYANRPLILEANERFAHSYGATKPTAGSAGPPVPEAPDPAGSTAESLLEQPIRMAETPTESTIFMSDLRPKKSSERSALDLGIDDLSGLLRDDVEAGEPRGLEGT